ncbi:ABC transporter permease [candidate division KSB1 bacterium]|nr:ABC transporter permease [candidate division KSB1 bacterium]
MLRTLAKIWAFIKKDFITQISYKVSFFLQIVGIFFSTVTFFFLARLLDPSASKYLADYGGDYFSFVLIGFAFSSYLQVSLQGFSKIVRESQMIGVLESLLVTQTELPLLIISSAMYNFIFTSLRVFVYLLIGIVFGIGMSGANYFGALVFLLLTIISFSSLGIFSAGFIVIFKKGDPFGWALTSLSWLLGGVYYPVKILPPVLQKIANFLPITHALEGMRMTLLQGKPLTQIFTSLSWLVLFTVIMFPASLIFFNFSVKKAKRDGSLVQY